MPVKKSKKSAKKTPAMTGYWKHVIENFSSHSKVWLEDFEIDRSSLKRKNVKNLYSTNEINRNKFISLI